MLKYTILVMLIIFLFSKTYDTTKDLYKEADLWNYFVSISQESKQIPSYDITDWVKQLHLQQCAVVEIGESFCALFVELRSSNTSKQKDNSGTDEFFLGICDCMILHTWEFCSSELIQQRHTDCTFTEATPFANTSARVHRRLCDITLLSTKAPLCNCSVQLAGQPLYKTKGFPTCFLDPLPKSLCFPRNVCGIAQCSALTVKIIHSPVCDPHCHQKQPFCEEIGPWTSIASSITSVWSRWSLPKCNNTCGKGFLTSTALCRNQITKKPAIDCIGPNPFCCLGETEKCICEVTLNNGTMKSIRYTKPCFSMDGCADKEKQIMISLQNEFHEHHFHNTFEGIEYEKPKKSIYRRLLAGINTFDDNYVIENDENDNEDYQGVNEKDEDNIEDITEDYEEDEKDDDEVEDNDDEELNEKEDDMVNITESPDSYDYEAEEVIDETTNVSSTLISTYFLSFTIIRTIIILL